MSYISFQSVVIKKSASIRALENDMKLAVQQNHLWGQFCTEILTKKRRLCRIIFS